ncbi:MAG: hypothetical protein GWN83_05440, partial [Gemmatimonadetes bacterium]|nr:hypothetical protein [Gemmatimonadota bacterium]NIY43034.1 hypothetical protein [Gemmatimonadota bacterium]
PEGGTLEEMYERSQPYAEVKVQQILIRVPEGASEAQEDSLERLAERLKEAA